MRWQEHLYHILLVITEQGSFTMPFSLSTEHKLYSELCFIFLKIYLFIYLFTYLFIERGEGNEKERERNINVWLSLARSHLGTWPETQACALTGS